MTESKRYFRPLLLDVCPQSRCTPRLVAVPKLSFLLARHQLSYVALLPSIVDAGRSVMWFRSVMQAVAVHPGGSKLESCSEYPVWV